MMDPGWAWIPMAGSGAGQDRVVKLLLCPQQNNSDFIEKKLKKKNKN